VIAFSTSAEVRRRPEELRRSITDLANDSLSELFQAAADATEEAIYNSLFMATTVRSRNGTVEALPVKEVLDLLRRK
jgi:D-aminopeptidase